MANGKYNSYEPYGGTRGYYNTLALPLSRYLIQYNSNFDWKVADGLHSMSTISSPTKTQEFIAHKFLRMGGWIAYLDAQPSTYSEHLGPTFTNSKVYKSWESIK